MKRHHHRWLRKQQGAALVLTLLIMLVLSALGLVAMRATNDSAAFTSMQRLHSQAKSLSEGTLQLGVMRSGSQASAYRQQLQSMAGQNIAPNDSEVGNADSLRRRGGYLRFTTDYEFEEDEGVVTFSGLSQADRAIQDANGPVTNFFDGRSGFVDAVEAERDASYSYIVRDMTLGPRVEGFGDEFCFVIVTIGSRSNIGNVDLSGGLDASERARRPQALGRNLKRTMIGPVECA